MKARRRPLLALALPLLLAACGGEDVEETPRAVPEVRLEALRPVGGVAWEVGSGGDCVERGTDERGTVVAQVGPHPTPDEPYRLQDFTLAPRYACPYDPYCGYVRVEVDPAADGAARRTESPATRLELVFEGLADGPHLLRVTLIQSGGAPALDRAGAPISHEVGFQLAAPSGCP